MHAIEPNASERRGTRLLELGSALAIAAIIVVGFFSMGAGLLLARLGPITTTLHG